MFLVNIHFYVFPSKCCFIVKFSTPLPPLYQQKWKLVLAWDATLDSLYNEKKYVEILLRYRQLIIKGDVFIEEWGIFDAEVFLRCSQFFIKGNFL